MCGKDLEEVGLLKLGWRKGGAPERQRKELISWSDCFFKYYFIEPHSIPMSLGRRQIASFDGDEELKKEK